MSPAGARSARYEVGSLVGTGLVILLAVGIRLWPIGDVFAPDGVRIVGDGDAVYHVVRARRAAAEWPRAPWVDPGLDHPYGALVPWPPLFDEMIATAAILTPGGADPEHVARVAAILPVLLAALMVLLLIALARVLIGGNGIAAAFIGSMVPASVHYGFVGLTDHHVAELLLWSTAFIAYILATRRERWIVPALGSGIALALSFWNWPGSGLYPLVLAAHAAVIHVIEPAGPQGARRAARALAAAAGFAALVLAVTVAMFARPGALRSMEIVSIGGLSVSLCTGAAVGACALLLAHGLRRVPANGRYRLAEVVIAGVVTLGVLLQIPGFLAGVRHGLAAAGAASGWYRSIAEFRVAVGSGVLPMREEILDVVSFYGLTLAVAPFGFAAMWREWRERPVRRYEILTLAVWSGAFLIAAMLRMRFMLYLSAPIAVLCASWLQRLTSNSHVGRWRELAILATALLLVAPAYAYYGKPGLAVDPQFEGLVAWLAKQSPGDATSVGVMAPWGDGHALRAAGLPVVSSPFGTDVGVRSLQDEARFFASPSGEKAYALARERRVGFVIIRSPLNELASVQDLLEPSVAGPVVATLSRSRGEEREPGPTFSRTIAARLFYGDGRSALRYDDPALGWTRLLRELVPPDALGRLDPTQVKVFGIVPGALLRVGGVAPGARVTARAEITTNVGRTFTWSTHAVASATGAAEIRVPYATGTNGACLALPYSVSEGERSAIVPVTDNQVTTGATVEVDLRS